MNNELRRQFHKAYIKADMDKLKYILSKALPRSLIKFCNGSYNKKDGSNCYLDTLRNNTLWLSSPREANKLCSTREIDTLLSAKADKVCESLKERDNSIINNVFVSCFSEAIYSKKHIQKNMRIGSFPI